MENNNLFWENTVKKTITVPTGKEELRNITATADCLKDKFSVRKMVKTAAVCAGFLALSTAAVKAQTYNPADIAAINAIIDNNGLTWPKAPTDGTSVPSEWNAGVVWINDGTNNRIQLLLLTNEGLTGTLNVTALTELDMLSCGQNNLTAIDVSANTKLKWLFCQDNNLTVLNVSANTLLEELLCGDNNLTTLNVSTNTQLYNFDCGSNNLTTLNVSANTLLEYLFCGNNNLTTLNVSANTLLEYLHCQDNNLTTLDVTGLPLTQLWVQQNYMADTNAVIGFIGTWGGSFFQFYPQKHEYDAADKEALRVFLRQPSAVAGQINAERVGLTLFDTATWYIEEDWVDSLSLDWNTDQPQRLIGVVHASFWLSKSLAGTLDASPWTELERLLIPDNQITAVNLNGLTKFVSLICSENLLTDLDVSTNTALEWLNCGENLLTTLDVSANTALMDLYCYDNNLTDLDVRTNTALVGLSCQHNSLTTLSMGVHAALIALNCSENHLTALDLSGTNITNPSWFKGENQTVSLTLYDYGSGIYQRSVPLNAPTFTDSEITYDNASSILSSTDNTVNSTHFTVETNLDTFKLSGTISFKYEDFVPVTDITLADTTATVGVPLPLAATVLPSTATYKAITWSLSPDDDGTTGATLDGSTFTAASVGTATLTATITNGKSLGENFTKDFTVTVTAVGIAENSKTIGLWIYPNPTTGKLFVRHCGLDPQSTADVEIYDVVGSLLQSKIVNQQSEIDISHLAAGLYFLKVDNKVIKVVKE